MAASLVNRIPLVDLVTALASADVALGQDCARAQRLAPAKRAGVTANCRQTKGSWGHGSAAVIRAVNEFFCSYGLCREVQVGDGAHYPVLLSIALMPHGVELPSRCATHAPGLRIQYRGHRDDLIALGCIGRDRLAAARFGRFEEDPRGALLLVESKAAPGRRRMIEVAYLAQSRSFAATLPGVRLYCSDWLQTLSAKPRLRLVIDNARRDPGNPAAERSVPRAKIAW